MRRAQPDGFPGDTPASPLSVMSVPLRATVAGAGLGVAAFSLGAALGAIRVLLLAPVLGALVAVGIELIVFLPILAWIAYRICRRLHVERRGARFMVGVTALAILFILEAGFATVVMKQDFAMYLRGVASPAGVLGLTGQLLLAWLPALTGTRAKTKHPRLGLDQSDAHRPC